MTTTETVNPTGLSPADLRAYKWLMEASDTLFSQGARILSFEARSEAIALLQAAPPAAPAIMRCEECYAVVKGEKRIAQYEKLGVDWLLCKRCEQRAIVQTAADRRRQ